MTHVESIATVLFKSTWNEGIIEDEVGAGLHHVGVPRTLPVVSGIGLAERKRASAWSSVFLFLGTQQENAEIPEWRPVCSYLSADSSPTNLSSSHNTNWLKTENSLGSCELKR